MSASPSSSPAPLSPLAIAAKGLANSVPDCVLEALREEWGNTNVAVIKHWRDAVKDELAALAVAGSAPQWLPLETAPKDGTTVLLLDREGHAFSGRWDRVDGWPSNIGLTHWMEMPTVAGSAPAPPEDPHRALAAKLLNIVLGDLEWVRAQGGRHSVCPLCHCVCEQDFGPGHAEDCPRIAIAEEFDALYPPLSRPPTGSPPSQVQDNDDLPTRVDGERLSHRQDLPQSGNGR